MINIAVLGYGTVGSGVVEVITTNQQMIGKRVGEDINIKYVLDLREFPGSPIENVLVHDFETVLNDEEVKIVVEVMGGVEPAYTFVKKCLLAGKSVATSNKELVAVHGAELLAIAKEKNVNFLFEASVGGGIPIIRSIVTSMTADKITEITGILNGTTNFILTKMSDEGADYTSTLKRAQDLGYAERNPEADVEGGDACRKIAILASLIFGKNLDYTTIHTEGITKITSEDFEYAKKLGVAIKLVGSAKVIDETLYAFVAPMMIGSQHPLAGINDVFNGIFVHGNMVDDLMFYGRGAGKLPTAAAVVTDVVEAAKSLDKNNGVIWSEGPLEVGEFAEAKHRFFVRINDEVNLYNKAVSAFGEVEFIELPEIAGEKAFVTKEMTEADFAAGIKPFQEVINTIRVAF